MPAASTLVVAMMSLMWLHGCGSGSSGNRGVGGGGNTVAAPSITTTPAQNGALILNLSSTTAGAKIYYTVDASTPTASSQQYQAPFLVASNLTVKAIAIVPGTSSTVASQAFSPTIPSGTLVWSDEFTNTSGSNAQPDPAIWTYDTGNSGFGNHELENYCTWGSSAAPCSTANPSEF